MLLLLVPRDKKAEKNPNGDIRICVNHEAVNAATKDPVYNSQLYDKQQKYEVKPNIPDHTNTKSSGTIRAVTHDRNIFQKAIDIKLHFHINAPICNHNSARYDICLHCNN